MHLISVHYYFTSYGKIFGIFKKLDTGQSDPNLLGVFDMVSRGHLILKPMVSLVTEETEDEVLAAMEEPCLASNAVAFHTPNSNVVREPSMESSEKNPSTICSSSKDIPVRIQLEGDEVHDEGLGKSFGLSQGSDESYDPPEVTQAIDTPDTGSIFSDAKTDEDELDDSLTRSGEDQISAETIALIGSGQFKLDFQPSFDVEREVEIKRALHRKLEKAKNLRLR